MISLVVARLQRLMFISMLGRYSQLLMRLLSVGHLFLLSVIYATAVLINVLACLWCAHNSCHCPPVSAERKLCQLLSKQWMRESFIRVFASLWHSQ